MTISGLETHLVARPLRKRKVQGLNPPVGKTFFIFYFPFSLCSLQLKQYNQPRHTYSQYPVLNIGLIKKCGDHFLVVYIFLCQLKCVYAFKTFEIKFSVLKLCDSRDLIFVHGYTEQCYDIRGKWLFTSFNFSSFPSLALIVFTAIALMCLSLQRIDGLLYRIGIPKHSNQYRYTRQELSEYMKLS